MYHEDVIEFRHPDSPYAIGVTRHLYDDEKNGFTLPDACWDLLFIKYKDQTHIILTGAITRPIPLGFAPGTEVMNITFRPDVFHTIPATQMLNVGKDLPIWGKRSFVFGGSVLEIPTFDNVEEFVGKMHRVGLLGSDKLVAGFWDGHPLAASDRSVQRHFLQTTGMTMKFVQQVQRAQTAIDSLKNGARIIDVAHSLGFTDQAHLTRSLKGIMGITPSAVANAK